MTPPELDPVLVEGSSRFAQVVDHRMCYLAIFWVAQFKWISFVQQEDRMYFAYLIMGDNDVDESGILLRILQVVAWVASNWVEQQQVLQNHDLECLQVKNRVSQ